MRPDQELNSLKNGLQALATLNQRGSVTIAELARELALPRTTAERILATLVSEGYVERVPTAKQFRLTTKIFALSSGFTDDSSLIKIATPLIFELTRQIGWPLAIATPKARMMVVRVTTDPATSLWLNRRRIGATAAMGYSSSGHAYLAFAPPAEREVLFEVLGSADVPERQRITDPKAMRALCETIRQRGYALSPAGGNEGSISVPILINGLVEAVLLGIYMSRVVSDQKAIELFVPHLKRLSSTISLRVTGGAPPAPPTSR